MVSMTLKDEFPLWLVFYGITEEKEIVSYRVHAGTRNLVAMKMKS
jgi:hypothetical protein